MIEVDKRNPYYCSHQGDLYTKDMRELLQYAIAKKDEIFVLPAGTEKIAFRAVSDAYFIKIADLQNVQIVGKKAFYYATSLERVIFKETTVIGEKAFAFTSERLTKEVRE